MTTATAPASPLTILMYHAVVRRPLEVPHWCFLGETAFRRQMQRVKATCRALRLAEAIERMHEGTLPERAVAVTFDDGFRNNHDIAFPVLRAYGIPASVMLTTGLIGTPKTLWFCRLHRAISQTRHQSLQFNSRRHDLLGPANRARASAHIADELKRLPQPELLARLDLLMDDLGDDPTGIEAVDSPYAMLDPAAIQQMQHTGMIDFGAHTRSHAILSRLPTYDARSEVVGSVGDVQAITGQPCMAFAYPNGRAQDYDQSHVALAREAGVGVGVTALEGVNDETTPRLELRRLGIGPGMPLADFDALLGLARHDP